MTDIARQVYEKLGELGIEYETMAHPPVLTIEDCLENDRKLGAVTAKNFFLATKNMKNFYLCLTRPNARFKSSDISKQLGSARLHFGPEEYLEQFLRLKPGAVSPMGLIFDEGRNVTLAVDSGLLETEKIAFHPCVNTETLAMKTADFFDKFLPGIGREAKMVEINDFLDD